LLLTSHVAPHINTLTKGFPVEVKIGVQNVAREIVLESEHLVEASGRRVMIPVATIGYVDVDASKKGAVGFGTI